MRYLLLVILMITMTTLFGQWVGGHSETTVEQEPCLNCTQPVSDIRHVDKTPLPVLKSRQVMLANESTKNIFFTEQSTPVHLVAVEDLSDSFALVEYQSLYDSMGRKVIAGDKQAISVFALKSPMQTAIAPRLTTNRAALGLYSETTENKTSETKANHALASLTNQKLRSITSSRDSNIALNDAVKPQELYKPSSAELASTILASTIDEEHQQSAEHQKQTALTTKAVMVESVATSADKTVASNGPVSIEQRAGDAAQPRKIPSYVMVPAAVAVASIAHSQRGKSNVFSRSNQAQSRANALAKKAISKPLATDFAMVDKISYQGRLGRGAIRAGSFRSGQSTDDDDIDDVVDTVDDLADTVDDLNDTVDDIKTEVSSVRTDVTTLEGQVDALQTQLGDNDVDALASQLNDLEDKTYAGIASAASLVTAIPSDPGKTVLNIGSGSYEGQTAIGISLSRRMTNVNGYLYSGVASGVSEVKSPLIRVGVGFEF